jgi:hypothetical protein
MRGVDSLPRRNTQAGVPLKKCSDSAIFRYAKTYSHREGWKPFPWGMGARHA